MMKDGTEDNKWSAGSKRTRETESTDSDEREQAITKLEAIDGRKKRNKEKRLSKCTGNCMATVLFLSRWASLEDPDGHKKKPLTCNMEPGIYHAQQWKLIY